MVKYLSIFVLIILYFTGCTTQPTVGKTNNNISKAKFQKVSWKDIKGFDQDNLDEALKVFKEDCEASKKYKNLEDICLKSTVATDGRYFFTRYFQPYKLLANNSDEGLITGYYEPMLQGSIKKTSRFRYPIYNVPKDLVIVDLSEVYPELKKYKLRGKLIGNILIPYDSRKDIENKINENNEFLKPICYVDDKIDLFFLHIQGSGKVELRDGTIINIGYGEQNGRKYYAIGKKLIEIGAIDKEDMSLQAIKQWLKKNPTQINEILNLNPSYIFFVKTKKNATGSLGVELQAQRNIAVDPDYIPLGFPVFLNTTNPIDKKPLNKLVVAADTGGAIKGQIRADLFFGDGIGAQELAGKMKQNGKMFILIPKNIDKDFK
jgi:membrane-bound lytic murein transglycosylase A